MVSDIQYAYLGMYDFPTLRPAQNTWWKGLAGHFRARGLSKVPNDLNRSVSDPYDLWQASNLFFAQTCGYPLTHRLAGKVQLIGTPCYDAPGCQGPQYRSLFIAGPDSAIENLASMLPARIAINAKDSFSGWRTVCSVVDNIDMDGEPFSEVVISGSHAKSIDLVREGKADIAAIDCVTHALIGDVEPGRLEGTRIVEQGPLAPGLPYITRANMDAQDIRAMTKAVEDAFINPELADARQTLRLIDFDFVPLSQYVRIMK
ncbi:MAG: PhnD/SsuA/transferrin family substrate-binding protein [Rhodospirillaceae bacterium]|nr:PhnD/SsuA/transferrin family substrate-binding protein [Rhodospirillaceae bacterium]MBL6942141.1 PhnD/SsuA/transferrin family substrate-binding protein [Rhodospirillales bacterium]